MNRLRLLGVSVLCLTLTSAISLASLPVAPADAAQQTPPGKHQLKDGGKKKPAGKHRHHRHHHRHHKNKPGVSRNVNG